MNHSDEELIAAAQCGDEAAWRSICDRYVRLVWAVAVGCGLSDTDAADVVQLTWSRLVISIDSLARPEHLRYWLQTTTRREAWKVKAKRPAMVSVPSGSRVFETRDASVLSDPGEIVVGHVPDPNLLCALQGLGVDCRTLVLMLVDDPPATYATVAETFGLAIGSIGATRRRCLNKLKELYEKAVVEEEGSWQISTRNG